MHRAPRSRAGFTLLEVMLACVLMAVAVLGLMALIPSTTALTETTQESNLALNASLQVAEAVRQYADAHFAYVWRAYNSDPSDDPSGAGTAPGATFSIDGLVNASGTSDVGTLTFFIDETETSAEAVKAGLPKDLNRDGDDTDVDVSGSFTLLPYRISVQFQDHNGLQRNTEIFSQVSDY